jgi:hypothetical protein
MIDPLVSLAFAVYSNKGAYALLLGSGISRASGIPTGWEVVLDLIRKVAMIKGEDCEPDPEDWFRRTFSSEPDYSNILDEVAGTPAERQQLLRGYFEPTEVERCQGLKVPSAAHKSIANLVASGYLRVIVTTNFDRLMEKALEEVGVVPTVISTADQLSGAMPLVHSGATVIKLHGDYLDTRIKNTGPELAKYDPEMDEMLDRIFDEYGLIVTGWSGDWDIALRAAIERSPSRRFTTFWATRSLLSEKGRGVADLRRAVVLKIKDADQFFESLQEKVQALGDMAAPHPLSAKIAAATVKRYLVEPSAKIRLRDFVHEETERLYVEINGQSFRVEPRGSSGEAVARRIEHYATLCEILISIFVAGCYWGDAGATKLWVNSLQRIGNPNQISEGAVGLIKLSRYPALLLLYSAGLAAIAAGNYKTLSAIMLQPRIRGMYGNENAICMEVHPSAVFDPNIVRILPEFERQGSSVNLHLFDKLRGPLREFLPRNEDFEDVFDRFEYLLGLVIAEARRQDFEGGWSGPVGCFAWRGIHANQAGRTSRKLDAEIEAEGADWPLLKEGFFGGSLAQLKLAKGKFDAFLSQVQT